MVIERAEAFQLDEILSVLSSVDLPHEGVAEHLTEFLVARADDGKLVACAGLEKHGDLGILRSVAVLAQQQSSGIGSALVSEVLARASRQGLMEIALLTTTAKNYFERKFGFVEAQRSEYESRLKDSPEWNLPRCSSAVFMTRPLP